MGCPWAVRVLPMAYSWASRGLPVGCPWAVLPKGAHERSSKMNIIVNRRRRADQNTMELEIFREISKENPGPETADQLLL